MAVWLKTADPDFEDRFTSLLAAKRESAADVNDVVAAIIARVRAEGDRALIDLTQTYDGLDLRKTGIRVAPAEIAAARAQVDAKTLVALKLAHDRILDHHRRQLPKDDHYRDAQGAELGTRWTPVASVGLYVPGGTASYPSSVLMNAVPAKVAGVGRIVMVVPALKGAVNPLVLAAAELAGVSEIYRVGGAQAIAALAYGTPSIRPVVKIVGPGNAYVAAAKRQVFGQVGIDMVAGPSEVVVIADADNDPAWIAAHAGEHERHLPGTHPLRRGELQDTSLHLAIHGQDRLELHPRQRVIDDALRLFPANEIVIATHPEGRSNWLARNIVSRARARYAVPVHHLVVDSLRLTEFLAA